MAERLSPKARPPLGASSGIAAGRLGPVLDIESLRLRVPARDAAEGRAIAAEVAARLAAEGGALLGQGGSVALGEVRLSVPAPRDGDVAGAATGAIVRALSRAVSSSTRSGHRG